MARTPDSNDPRLRAQRGRNIALALVLAGLVVLFYVIAFVKMA